jgi:hypothetical protein
MSKGRQFVFSAETIAGASGIARRGESPAKIFHQCITPEELNALTCCVRPANHPEWFTPGFPILLVLRDEEDRELHRRFFYIKRYYENPVSRLTTEDIEGSLVEIAMERYNISVKSFLRRTYPGQKTMMVIKEKRYV